MDSSPRPRHHQRNTYERKNHRRLSLDATHGHTEPGQICEKIRPYPRYIPSAHGIRPLGLQRVTNPFESFPRQESECEYRAETESGAHKFEELTAGLAVEVIGVHQIQDLKWNITDTDDQINQGQGQDEHDVGRLPVITEEENKSSSSSFM